MTHLLASLITAFAIAGSDSVVSDTTGSVSAGPDTTASVAAQPDTTRIVEPGRYYSERGFSVRFPSGWGIEKTADGLTAVDSLSVTPRSTPVTVTVEMEADLPTNPQTAEDSLRVRLMKQATPDRVVLERMGLVSVAKGKSIIDKTPAVWEIRTFRAGPIQKRMIQYSLAKDGWVYVVTCVAPEKKFTSYRKTFEQIGLSLRVKQTQ
ncbi:MAG: hypothetical protein HY710_08620 [Candidatus Latescibacteria bacterium]|nr:hypothetical protein [Candidatus Latescibacterota bacterium]